MYKYKSENSIHSLEEQCNLNKNIYVHELLQLLEKEHETGQGTS